MNIYLEIFGYFGTALVIVSMMMSSVVKLRIINMCGGLISLIYAVLVNAWPVVVLNLSLIAINFVQTVRQLRVKNAYSIIKANAKDGAVSYYFSLCEQDIKAAYGEMLARSERELDAYLILKENEIIGVLLGHESDSTLDISLFHTLPHHNANEVGSFIISELQGKKLDKARLCNVK